MYIFDILCEHTILNKYWDKNSNMYKIIDYRGRILSMIKSCKHAHAYSNSNNACSYLCSLVTAVSMYICKLLIHAVYSSLSCIGIGQPHDA